MDRSADRRRRLGGILLLLAAAFVMSLGTDAGARNPIRTSFFNVYPSAIGSRLDNLPSIQGHCGVCHYQFGGAGPRNPYGLALEAILGNFPNNDAGRQQAIRSIENQDADGDGFSQLIEITDRANYTNTPTFPGLTPGNVNQVSGVNVNDILAYLVPESESDTQAPVVTVVSPNGGESWEGGSARSVTWTATDNVGVTAVDIFYRDSESAAWKKIVGPMENTGVFTWHVHNTPTTTARVRVVARDAIGNQGTDSSNGLFTILAQTGSMVATTLRDFDMPGTQPFQAGAFNDRATCAECHGGYDPATEQDYPFKGSMMAQSARDPIFYAALAVAEQDAASSGDLCLRCHTPMGWLAGRSNPTDGSRLTLFDREGVACDFCHRLVDPIYRAGESPLEDQEILAGLAAIPTGYSNGQFVVDPESRRRGPFADAAAPHPFLESPFHRSGSFCGTCHDVSNPVFNRVAGADYAPGPLDTPPGPVDSETFLPVERTYSEWLNSDFPAGVYAPEFAGNRPDGMVFTCQDCHMRDVEGRGCDDPGAPIRPDLPFHDMMGGNYWMPLIIDQVYPGEVDPQALADGAARAVSMLQLAATVEVALTEVTGAIRADVTVTNRSGHKLPTGYPEGRRMWIHLRAYDEADQVVHESGAYDAATGVLAHEEDAVIYEAKMGISPAFASAIGLSAGPSFHFVLNDSIYKDNRIPPAGFTNAAYDLFGGTPVDPDHEGPDPRYADGQNWDTPSYSLPLTTRRAIATLYYQTTSKEYIEFLRDENNSNGAGQAMYDLWVANGRAAPLAMTADTAQVAPSAVAEDAARISPRMRLAGHPFRDRIEILLDLPEMSPVAMEVFDPNGRRVRSIEYGRISGNRRIVWDGIDDDGRPAGSGIYWVRLRAGEWTETARVVLLR